ncbi:hypothetical protein AB0D08_37875, partial [Kitasatospora sp. NPDC048540]|uniref:hypothetical protein n=1 Tax=Kitasatospora sp. NPDC048540 TaxID=3155634 RepID=UPI0033E710B7
LHGEDIAATFAEATEGLSGRAVLRERLDLASHALRLRLRISSAHPAGRMLAAAAPVALALAAGERISGLPGLVQFAAYSSGTRPGMLAVQAVMAVVMFVPWIVALLCATAGRWRPARAVAAFAALIDLGIALLILGRYGPATGELLRTGALAALLLLAPPDLVDTGRRGRWETASVALATGARLAVMLGPGVTLLGLGWYEVPAAACFWSLVAVAGLLLVHLSARRPDRLRAIGIALGAGPWLLQYAGIGAMHWVVAYSVVLIGGAVAAGGVVHLVRRMLGTEPAEPA